MCPTVDSARDIGSHQWAISVLFNCLFNTSLDFLLTLLALYQSARSGTLVKRRGCFLFNPNRQISGHDASLYSDSKMCFVRAI